MPHSKVRFGGQMPHPLGDLRSSEMISVFQGIALQAVLAFFKAYQSISLQPTGHECGTLSSKVLQNVGFGPV